MDIRKVVIPMLFCLCMCAAENSIASRMPGQKSTQPVYAELIPPDKLGEDLDLLFKTIDEVHPNMYAYTSKKEFSKLRDKLYRKAARPMTRLEFYKAVAPVVAALKSGHTFVMTPQEEFAEYAKNGGKMFPVHFLCTGDAVTLAIYWGNEEIPVGAEVLTIDGEKAKEYLKRLARYWPAEGKEYNLGHLERGGSSIMFFLWLEKGHEESLKLTLKSPDGVIDEYAVVALSHDEINQAALKKQAETAKHKTQDSGHPQLYTYRHIPDANVGLITFNFFKDRQQFGKFLKTTSQDVQEQNVENLIIDIRNNPGGNNMLGDDFLKYLTDKPFCQFEKAELKISEQACARYRWIKREDPNIKIGSTKILKGKLIKPGDNPLRFKGKVFVLIGPKSASSSVSFASVMKHFHIGTLIGQETIDTPVNYGDIIYEKLSHSGLTFAVACKRFVCAGGKADGRGLMPHHEVRQKPEDTAKGVDTVLEFTLALIKNGGTVSDD